MMDRPFTPPAVRPVVINNEEGEKLQEARYTTPVQYVCAIAYIRRFSPKYCSTGCHAWLSEAMDSLFLGIILGFVAGYMVRALISQVRRRRFEEDYGLNPRSRLRHRP
jgi:hypothetical protein